MKTLKLFFAAIVIMANLDLMAQVAINTDNSAADNSAMLDIKSDSTGLLIPRMTAAQRDAINNPAQGLMVFVTTDSSFYYYRNSAWSIISSDSALWQKSGNNIYTTPTGNVGIGTSNPSDKLTIIDTNVFTVLRINNYSNDWLYWGFSGIYIRLSGTGTGKQYGIRQEIDNASSGIHVCNYNKLTGSGSGNQYGSMQEISNWGSGAHFGNLNELKDAGSGNQYGSMQLISNWGSGDHYGVYNRLYMGGNGTQYGTCQKITNYGNGIHYGIYNYLYGGGSGNKYGTYDSITIDNGGTHYGVYSVVEGDGNYAGYFKGRMYVRDSMGIGITDPSHKLYVRSDSAGLSYLVKLENHHDATSDDAAGILFSAGGSGSNNRGKGGLVYEVTNTWNRGSFHFLQDQGANTDNPDLNDAVFTIQNNGFIGIGTQSPLINLHVRNDNISLPSAALRGEQIVLEDNDAGMGLYSSNVGNYGSFLSWAEVVSGALQNKWSIIRTTSGYSSYENQLRFTFGTNVNYANNSTILTLDESGYVGIGDVSPSYRLELPNSAGQSGEGRAYAWITYSDGRLKTNQQTIDYGLSTIMQLNPKRYLQHTGTLENGSLNLLNGNGNTENTIGFVAQELYKVVPEAAFPPEDESKDFWAVDYERLIPILTKAIQEQQAIIEKQKEENNQQNKTIAELVKRLEKLESDMKDK